jgi:DNA helicase-2/ATP-dependent DNA helicase PcrA
MNNSMNNPMNNPIDTEQSRVDQVLAIINQQLAQLEQQTGALREEVVDIRKHFWDDVTVNKDHADDLLETFVSMKQQAEVLSQRERSHLQAFKQLSALRRLRVTPYFGRIDFQEEGLPSAEHIYIGVSSLTDASGEHFLIYDWRAPVSSVYYDYPPGPASYNTPGGIIQGNLEEKWQYVIRDGQILSLFDTSVTIGDEVLQQVLGQGTNQHMRSIVATIQQEQNQIIRHDRGRLLIVQGPAGSGKTSATLQRIAYLLYKYRTRITASQIILFSPNAMFNSYVSNVLPELGEENMQQATFQEYLSHRLGSSFQVEDPYAQLEYVLTAADKPDYPARMASIRFKASVHFYTLIKSYQQSLTTSGLLFKSLRFRGSTLISAKEISARFYGQDTALRFHNRIEALTEWLLERLNEVEKLERKKPWVQEEIELLSNEDYQRIYVQLRKKSSFTEDSFNDFERENTALSRYIVRRRLKPLRERIKQLQYLDITGIYRKLFSDSSSANVSQWFTGKLPEEWETLCELTIQMLDKGKLYYEDATPYLLLKELIEGFQTNVSIKQVLVDEAQDYSAFQFEFLKRLFPSAQMTVLGDFNQAIFAHAQETSNFNPLTGLYGEQEADSLKLSRSYRSTLPIVLFTRSLVQDGGDIEPFERPGNKPVITVVQDSNKLHGAIIAQVRRWLQEQVYKTIAIICKTAAESATAYDSLQSLEGIKRITDSTAQFEQGVVVIPAYLAKGIEFDAVILYNASEKVYADENHRRLFYTACTRAMHELHLFSVGKLTPLLTGVDPSTYESD